MGSQSRQTRLKHHYFIAIQNLTQTLTALLIQLLPFNFNYVDSYKSSCSTIKHDIIHSTYLQKDNSNCIKLFLQEKIRSFTKGQPHYGTLYNKK